MPERQASPGEVTSRPPDATGNGSGAGAAEAARAGGSSQPAAEATTVVQAAAGERAVGGSQPSDAEGNGTGTAAGSDGATNDTTTTSTTSTDAGAGTPGGAPQGSGAPRPAPAPRPQQAPRPGPEPAADDSPTVRTAAEQPQQAQPAQQAAQQPTEKVPAAGPDAGGDAATTAVVTPAARPAPAKGSWFASVDAEDTQVIPRTAMSAPAPAAPQPEPGTDAVTEVIPVTRVGSPPVPPPAGPGPQAAGPADPGSDGGKPRTKRNLLVVTAVVAALGVLYGADLLFGAGSVPRGVTVAGVSIGGLPLDEAEQRLRAEIEPRLARPVPVTVGDASSEINPGDAGLAVDWPATIDRAGEQPLNPITRITSFFTERPVDVVTTADTEALHSALEELAPVVDKEPTEGTVRFEGVEPQPVDPVPGQKLDVAAAADVLQRDWASGAPVSLPLTEIPATTTPEDVATAVEEVARPAVAAPVTFIGENNVRGTLSPEVIASALSFRADNGTLVPELNQQAVQDALAPQMAASERPGRDATIDFSSGQPVVVPSQDGRGIDYQASLTELLDVLTSEGPREITAVYADQPAKVTTEDLKALGNPQVIGEFTTGGFAPDSGVNIRRAAQLINGIVVKPGETFSLDKATGPRTLANGYVEAGVIDNGQPSRGPAGGVSQVSTTLYNAAYFAGMTLVQHKAHSFYISRYPAGREATIATGAIDNRFRNDNPTPVLIRTEWTPRSVTVRIYGQRQFEVTGEFGPRTNPTQPNTVNIPSGKPCNPSNGAPGFTITDTRTLRNVSTGDVRRETFTTKYNPVPRVVCGQ